MNITTILAIFVTALALTACGGGSSGSWSPLPTNPAVVASTPEPTPESTPTPTGVNSQNNPLANNGQSQQSQDESSTEPEAQTTTSPPDTNVVSVPPPVLEPEPDPISSQQQSELELSATEVGPWATVGPMITTARNTIEPRFNSFLQITGNYFNLFRNDGPGAFSEGFSWIGKVWPNNSLSKDITTLPQDSPHRTRVLIEIPSAHPYPTSTVSEDAASIYFEHAEFRDIPNSSLQGYKPEGEPWRYFLVGQTPRGWPTHWTQVSGELYSRIKDSQDVRDSVWLGSVSAWLGPTEGQYVGDRFEGHLVAIQGGCSDCETESWK